MKKRIGLAVSILLIALITACTGNVAISPTVASKQIETVQAPLVVTSVPPTSAISGKTLPAPAFSVTSVTYTISTWSDTVKGGQYTNCPLVTATITANGAGTVNYYWLLASLSAQHQESKDEDLIFESAGAKTISWRFQVKDTPRSAMIYITSPNAGVLSASEDLPPCSSAP